MNGKRNSAAALGLTAIACLIVVAGGCTPPAGPGSTGLIGTWTGTATIVETASPPGQDPVTDTRDIAYTLTIGSDGRPTSVPLFGIPGGAALTLFDVAAPQTFTSEVPISDSQSADGTFTIGVTVADFAENSFRLVYTLDITLTGDSGTVRIEGTETYQAELTGDGKVSWSDVLDVVQTTNLGDGTNEVVPLVNTVTAELER